MKKALDLNPCASEFVPKKKDVSKIYIRVVSTLDKNKASLVSTHPESSHMLALTELKKHFPFATGNKTRVRLDYVTILNRILKLNFNLNQFVLVI